MLYIFVTLALNAFFLAKGTFMSKTSLRPACGYLLFDSLNVRVSFAQMTTTGSITGDAMEMSRARHRRRQNDRDQRANRGSPHCHD